MFDVMHQFHQSTFLVCKSYGKNLILICVALTLASPLQPDVLVRRAPPVHGQQRGHGDGLVPAGPAAHEAAHVLLLPEQLRRRLRTTPAPASPPLSSSHDYCYYDDYYYHDYYGCGCTMHADLRLLLLLLLLRTNTTLPPRRSFHLHHLLLLLVVPGGGVRGWRGNTETLRVSRRKAITWLEPTSVVPEPQRRKDRHGCSLYTCVYIQYIYLYCWKRNQRGVRMKSQRFPPKWRECPLSAVTRGSALMWQISVLPFFHLAPL